MAYKDPKQTIVTIPLEPTLHRKLRVKAAGEGRTIKWLVTHAIKQLVGEVA
jgi:hypothetical protein